MKKWKYLVISGVLFWFATIMINVLPQIDHWFTNYVCPGLFAIMAFAAGGCLAKFDNH